MQSASQAFTPQDRERINQAVQQAERGTSAEIVPVVASVSGRYDRPEDIVGLWLALAAMVVVWFVFPAAQQEHGSWETAWPHWKLLAMLVATVLAFVAGAALATNVAPLRRLFTPRTQMADEVLARAGAVFYSQAVHHTAGQSGVLIYVSLYERMAAVLADQSVMDNVGPGTLDELRDTLIVGLRAGDVTDALCQTIQAAGQRLAPVLPREADDVNELPDALVTLDLTHHGPRQDSRQ